MRRIVKKGVGVLLIILGFLALVTPCSPGSWLILVGLELLGLRILLEERLLTFAKARPGSLLAKIIHKLLRVKDREPGATDGRQRDTDIP